MTRRAVVIGMISVATIGMASCSKAVQSSIAVDKAFTRLISADTTMLAGADLEGLKSSPLYAKYKGELHLRDLDEFSQQFGVDPRRDISQLLYVTDETRGYLLARGTFRTRELERKLQEKGLKPTQYKSINLFGDARNSLALLKGSVLVMGSANAVRAAIDTEDGGRGEVPEEIADRLRSIPKADQVWFVSRNGLPFASAANRTDIQSALSNIVGFVRMATGSLRVDTGVRLKADFGCNSADGATRVHDGLRAAVAIGRLSTKDNETSLLNIYDAVHIEQKESTVRANAELTGGQVDELVSRFGKR
ncbi:MAG: hypothetical protein ACJ746_12860 [Bryobacteraceae bacterium]